MSKECETCHGEGIVEFGPDCSRPASDCCGGCYREAPCPDCHGDEVDEEPFDFSDEPELDMDAEVVWEVAESGANEH